MDQLIRDKSWSDIEGSEDLQEQLRDLDRRNPYTAVVAIIHPDGRIVASSLPQAVGGNISDREHIRAFGSGHRGLYVGPRQTLALSKIDTLVISRQARLGPPGAILIAPIPVAVVAEFFAAHAPHPRYVASLLRDDGWLLVRRDPTQQAIRIGEKEPAMVAIRGADSGLYEAKAVSDGIERIYAFVRIRDLPVVVNYGVARYAVWSDYGYRLALVLLLLGLLAALGFAMATHSLKQALAGESRRIELEEKVASRTADLRRLVAQKDLLIKEVHHRIKNNLAMVSSLLRVQSRTDPVLQEAAQEAIGRIESIAALHSTFYLGEDVKEVHLDELVSNLVSNIVASTGTKVTVNIDADKFALDLDRATPLAMICNEVVTNALKHAFPDGKGTIDIRLKSSGSSVLLEIKDDGVGGIDPSKSNGLGMRLIKSFSDQLGGIWSFESARGTVYRLELPAIPPPPPSSI